MHRRFFGVGKLNELEVSGVGVLVPRVDHEMQNKARLIS